MGPECDRCGSPEDVETATIIDHDGGAHVNLCGRCRGEIQSNKDLCAVCRLPRRGSRKAESIFFNETLSQNLPICDSCRDRLIRGVAPA